jgi:hypothetical protein
MLTRALDSASTTDGPIRQATGLRQRKPQTGDRFLISSA